MWLAGPARRIGAAGAPGALKLGFDLKPGMRMRVGVFGGSFNPAHEGHAHVARTALGRLRLDRVIWLVSPQNPLKASHGTALTERMASARRFARGPDMIVSDAETRFGSSYTIDTLRKLKGRYPGVRFVWIMGADNLAGFHRWRGWAGHPAHHAGGHRGAPERPAAEPFRARSPAFRPSPAAVAHRADPGGRAHPGLDLPARAAELPVLHRAEARRRAGGIRRGAGPARTVRTGPKS